MSYKHITSWLCTCRIENVKWKWDGQTMTPDRCPWLYFTIIKRSLLSVLSIFLFSNDCAISFFVDKRAECARQTSSVHRPFTLVFSSFLSAIEWAMGSSSSQMSAGIPSVFIVEHNILYRHQSVVYISD